MNKWYQENMAAWQDDPEKFWAEAATAIDWIKPCDKVLDDSAAPLYPLGLRAASLTHATMPLTVMFEAGAGIRRHLYMTAR